MRRLDEKYEFFSVNPTQWFNLLSTIPQLISTRGILYLLYHNTEIIHAFHSLQGSRPDLTGPFSSPTIAIHQLQQREDVDAVIMLEQGLASYLIAKMQAAFSPETDIFQYLELADKSIREELGRRFHVWPKEFWEKSLLSLLNRICQLLDELPPDFVCVLTVFEENLVWASLIVNRSQGQIKHITTTKHLEPLNFEIKEWQTDYSKLLKTVAQKLGQPTLGFFTDDETLRFLLRSETPIKFIQQALRTGQIIIDPFPGSIKRKI